MTSSIWENLRVIFGGSLREQLRMIKVRFGNFTLSVREHCWNYINYFIRHFSILTISKINFSFDSGVNSLVLSYNYILSWLPLEPSLSRDDIIGKYFLASKFFYSNHYEWMYPNLLPAESLLFWVEEACILDAQKLIFVVSCLKTGLLIILNEIKFMIKII